MEGADLVNVALGALINLAEHAPEHRARFVSAPLPGGRRLLPLLCRVLQAGVPRIASPDIDLALPRLYGAAAQQPACFLSSNMRTCTCYQVTRRPLPLLQNLPWEGACKVHIMTGV